ncbi:glycosyltransferase family A protein [Sediminibacterium ginsengisoli]|uniref:Glycosyl transferase family 2 n=1 Tax=Sediminibacterium ginsengisoli TaxID=413434 RepID=A0A1T4RB80_9BACT|nr:glycosyltransferase family A protein [Sediminibacterium ginsengisoli]SKA13179.1 Glycosyl transferase family 2 [Sediminibacterium ginsengisoli]
MPVNKLPKVSVIIPALNEERYILRALQALVAQDYPDFEIIVTDNASTDHTSAVVRRFICSEAAGHIPIQLLYEQQRGTNFARECARKAATGSVIVQMDADCIPHKHWLRKGISLLLRGKHAAVTGPYYYFDAAWILRESTVLVQKWFYPVVNRLVQLNRRSAILIGGNAFIRAGLLEAAGGYNTALTFYGDDIDLGGRLCRFGSVAYSPAITLPSSARRYHTSGFWKVNRKYQSCFWKTIRSRHPLFDTIETEHPR